MRKEPSGGKHGPCTTHVPHPYTTNGWLCVNGEPGRADAMLAFADDLSSIAARHHEAEALRPTADGTAARWHEPIRIDPDGRPVMPAGVCTMKNAHNGPRAFCGGTIHLHTMGGPAIRSKCAGHTCRAIVGPAVVETPAPIVKARKTSTRHIHRTADGGAVFVGMSCAECGHAPIAQHDGVSIGQESRILSTPFALPDPIAAADALDIYDERVNIEAARAILADPVKPGPMLDQLSRTILSPARSLVEPTRPEPIPVARPALVVVRDGRPCCPRCGQTFRRNGTGAAWHAVNRPDCRAEFQRASA